MDVVDGESETMKGMGGRVRNSSEHVCSFENCSKTFRKPSRLLQHMRTHTGERPFQCHVGECDKSYTRAAHLKRHIITGHQEKLERDQQMFRCEEENCAKRFQSRDSLKKHVKICHLQLKYKCQVEGCEEAFHKKVQWRAHTAKHQGLKAFQCGHQGCGKTFTDQRRLERHAKMHNGYRCSEEACGKIFPLWTLLRKHKAIEHAKETSCLHCGKKFNKPYWLKVHARTHQSTREMYLCSLDGCERGYFDKRNLNAHVRMFHEGHRFTCSHDGCGRTFSTKQKLKHHLPEHDPDKPLKKKKTRRVRQPASLASKLSQLPDKEGRSVRLVFHPDSDIVEFVGSTPDVQRDSVFRKGTMYSEASTSQGPQTELLTQVDDMGEREVCESQISVNPSTDNEFSADNDRNGNFQSTLFQKQLRQYEASSKENQGVSAMEEQCESRNSHVDSLKHATKHEKNAEITVHSPVNDNTKRSRM